MAEQLPGDREHILTVDVEEYYQSPALGDIVIPEEWPSLPSRVELATERLLDVLDEHGATATFFVGPWIADRHAQLIEAISNRGHEVASRETNGPPEFGEGVFTLLSRARAFKSLLETLTGRFVHGHRPSPVEEWDRRELVSRLARAGYSYTSWLAVSVGDGEGASSESGANEAGVTTTDAGSIMELPLAGLEFLGMRVPVSDRPSLRHVPLEAVRRGLESREASGEPGVLTLRTWEADEHQPRFALSPINRVMQYGKLDRTVPRLETLLEEYRFTSARDCLGLGDGASKRRTVLSGG